MSSEMDIPMNLQTKLDTIWIPIDLQMKGWFGNTLEFPLAQHLDSYWLIQRRFGLDIYWAVPLT